MRSKLFNDKCLSSRDRVNLLTYMNFIKLYIYENSENIRLTCNDNIDNIKITIDCENGGQRNPVKFTDSTLYINKYVTTLGFNLTMHHEKEILTLMSKHLIEHFDKSLNKQNKEK